MRKMPISQRNYKLGMLKLYVKHHTSLNIIANYLRF